MRILLAYDGSVGAEQARDLLAHLELPPNSTITAVTAVHVGSTIFERELTSGDPAEAEAALIDDLREGLTTATRALEGEGRTVERRVVRGRPATVILAEAELLGAELIVIGSRGYGPIQTLLLGSVSTEVVDHASCPVLVARAGDVHKVLFATDGTETSVPAFDVVHGWPLFRRYPVEVVSVSEPIATWTAADPGFASARWIELEMELADERLEAHRGYARQAAETLKEGGLTATWQVRTGYPPEEILRTATEVEADLIVIGTHQGSGSFPGAIGSVARNVLHRAHASVLVVRGHLGD
jgi:nucleotide-binding universal stress UspA family protein